MPLPGGLSKFLEVRHSLLNHKVSQIFWSFDTSNQTPYNSN